MSKTAYLLQTQPIDTLNIQEELEAVAEKLSTTPVTELAAELIDMAVSFGLKALQVLL